MSSCCHPDSSPPRSVGARCPVSGSRGRAVGHRTVHALLMEVARQRLPPGDLRFCPDSDCDVVYFGAEGVCFRTADLRVPVWQKSPMDGRVVCYCFGESEASIRHELERHGESSAVVRIRAHIAAGRCACDVRNPGGTCCLGDVVAAVERVQALRAPVSRD